MEWTNGVWNFMGESKKRVGHPAPFPVELPMRCIKLFSFVEDTVFDPFLGSGSTLIACVKTNRKGIGIEIDKNYCKLAKQRLIEEGQIYQLKFKEFAVIKDKIQKYNTPKSPKNPRNIKLSSKRRKKDA